MRGRAVHLYNRWGRIKRLVGVNIYIILPIVVFVEVLQAQVDVILEALSRNITPFLLVPKDQRPFFNTRKASPNYCMRYIAESWPKAVGVISFVRSLSYKDALVAATVHCRFVCPYNLTLVFNCPRAYLMGKCKSLLALPFGELWLWVSDILPEAFLFQQSPNYRVGSVESCFSRELGVGGGTRPIVRFNKVD